MGYKILTDIHKSISNKSSKNRSCSSGKLKWFLCQFSFPRLVLSLFHTQTDLHHHIHFVHSYLNRKLLTIFLCFESTFFDILLWNMDILQSGLVQLLDIIQTQKAHCHINPSWEHVYSQSSLLLFTLHFVSHPGDLHSHTV